jgi:hypothetical protein
MDDLFGAGELFVTSHLMHGFAEAGGGKSREGDGIEVFRFGLRAQFETYGGVRAGLPNSPPQGKEFFSCYENARLIQEARRQTDALK